MILEHKKNAICIVIIAALVMILFYDPLFTGRVFYLDDFEEMGTPVVKFIYEMGRAGKIFMWNPYQYGGNCFLASPAAFPFSPLRWIFFLVPPERAIVYYVVLYYFLAGLFMFWMLRGMGMGRGAAMAGALFFAFSGPLLVRTIHVVLVATVVLMPLIFLLIDRMLKRGDLLSAFLLGLAMGFHFLQGHYISSQLMLVVASIYFVCRAGIREILSRDGLRLTGLFLLAVVFGLALQAVQFFPVYEYVSHCTRFGGFASFGRSARGSMEAGDLLTLLVPDYYGNPLRPPGYNSRLVFWDGCCYLGIFPLMLMLLSPVLIPPEQKRRAAGFFFSGLFVLLYVLGENTPFYRLLFDFVPFFKSHRLPVRYFPLLVPMAAYFLALAVEYLPGAITRLEKDRGRMLQRAMLGAGLLFAALFYFFSMHPPAGAGGLLYRQNVLERFQGSLQTPEIFTGLVFFVLTGVAGLAVIWAGAGGKITRRQFFACTGFILVISAFSFGFTWNPAIDQSYFRQREELFRPLGGQTPPVRVMYHPGLYKGPLAKTINTPGSCGVSNVLGYSTMMLSLFTNYMLFADEGVMPGKDAIDRVLDSGNRYRLGMKDPTGKMIRLFNVQYVYIASDDQPSPQPIWVKVPEPYPRAFVVRKAAVEPDDARTLAMLRSDAFDPLREVILPGGPGGKEEAGSPAGEDGAGAARFLEYQPDYLRLEVEAPAGGWLFLSEVYYPGWRARVDGQERDVLRANYLFRAVPLVAGERVVELYFHPGSLQAGGLVSGASFLLMALAVWIERKRKGKAAGGSAGADPDLPKEACPAGKP